MTPETLRHIPLFQSLDDASIEQLCELLETIDCKPEQTLFRAGDAGNAMYIIETGRVRINVKAADGHEINVADLGPGEFFGEMAMLDSQPRSANAVAAEQSRLALLSRKHFMAFIEGNSKVALDMLGALAHRLRSTDELVRRRVSRNVNEEEAAHLTFADRAADVIAQFGGSWGFIIVFLVLLFIWAALNLWVLGQKSFDPYPFVFLNLVLAVVTSLQAPIIMMSQNRQSHKDRLRSDLDYQLNLKNEITLGEILERLEALEHSVQDKSAQPDDPAV